MRRGFLGRLSKSEPAGGEGKDGGSGMKLSLPPAKPGMQGLWTALRRLHVWGLSCLCHLYFIYFTASAGSVRPPTLYGTTGAHVSTSRERFMTACLPKCTTADEMNILCLFVTVVRPVKGVRARGGGWHSTLTCHCRMCTHCLCSPLTCVDMVTYCVLQGLENASFMTEDSSSSSEDDN